MPRKLKLESIVKAEMIRWSECSLFSNKRIGRLTGEFIFFLIQCNLEVITNYFWDGVLKSENPHVCCCLWLKNIWVWNIIVFKHYLKADIITVSQKCKNYAIDNGSIALLWHNAKVLALSKVLTLMGYNQNFFGSIICKN